MHLMKDGMVIGDLFGGGVLGGCKHAGGLCAGTTQLIDLSLSSENTIIERG